MPPKLQPLPAERLLSPTATAERLSVSLATVWRLVRNGKLTPIYHLGARVTRIPESALARYLEGCKVD